MKLGGDALRIELIPETDEDKDAIKGILARERVIRQVLNNSTPLIFWGDADEGGCALIISSHVTPTTLGITDATTEPACPATGVGHE